MKRSAIAFLLVAPYMFVACVHSGDVSSWRFLVGISVLGLVCGLNMVNAMVSPRHGADAKTYLFWNMVLKLTFVPLYAVCTKMVIESHVMMMSVLLLVYLGGLVLILTTSSYGWRGLWLAENTGLMRRKVAVTNAILHAFYFVDVFSAIYCFWRVCRAEKDHD